MLLYGHIQGLVWVVLGGSWVVISGVISPLIWVIITVTLLITPLITTHEPPSRCRCVGFGARTLLQFSAAGSRL